MERVTQAELRERLHYDPETGIFVWRMIPANHFKDGRRAGHQMAEGYRNLRIGNVLYREHRLAWFYVTGEWPVEIDHINRNPSDNRLCNLRVANRALNNWNTNVRADNKLGIKGVRKVRTGMFDARIRSDHKLYNLGTFATAEEAAIAYRDAEVRLRGPS